MCIETRTEIIAVVMALYTSHPYILPQIIDIIIIHIFAYPASNEFSCTSYT